MGGFKVNGVGEVGVNDDLLVGVEISYQGAQSLPDVLQRPGIYVGPKLIGLKVANQLYVQGYLGDVGFFL